MAGFRHILLAAALCAGVCSVQGLVGGDAEKLENTPWLVQFVYYNPVIKTMIQPLKSCVGVIVNENTILSAAECFPEDSKYYEYADRYTAVRVGSVARQDGGEIVPIETIVHHPKYHHDGDLEKPFNQKFDIAVVKLAKPLEFSSTVGAIKIATERVAEGTRAFVSGWGSTKEDGAMAAVEDFAKTLHTAMVEVESKKSCEHLLSWSHFVTEAEHSLVCAKSISGSPCNGDNGSALYLPAEGDEAPKLFGIMHGFKNHGCAKDNLPLFVDIADKEVHEFLAANGAL